VHVIGEFREKESVRKAIDWLRAAGLGPEDLDLFSEEPVELPRRVLDRPSRMSLASVSGAILFGGLATAFVSWAQHNYKLITGGMPVFSFWATGVITYEMTMLGAIVSTFAWFLWESGLIRKRDRSAPVPEVAPGSICLRVRCGTEQAAPAIETMRRAGAIGIERRGES
jgi:ActD protein